MDRASLPVFTRTPQRVHQVTDRQPEGITTRHVTFDTFTLQHLHSDSESVTVLQFTTLICHAVSMATVKVFS